MILCKILENKVTFRNFIICASSSIKFYALQEIFFFLLMDTDSEGKVVE